MNPYVKSKMKTILAWTTLLVFLCFTLAAANPILEPGFARLEAEDLFENRVGFALLTTNADETAKFYTRVQEDTIYFMAIGDFEEDWSNILIDTDSDPLTGHDSWIWEDMGAEFLLDKGVLSKSTGPGWEWEKVKEVDYASFTQDNQLAIITALKFGDIGTLEDKITVGFVADDARLHMPAFGTQPADLSLFGPALLEARIKEDEQYADSLKKLPAVRTVTTYSELVAAAESMTDELLVINVKGDISFDGHLKVAGVKELRADAPVTLNVGTYRLEVTENSTLTISDNIKVLQPADGERHPVYVRGGSTLNVRNAIIASELVSTSCYTINANGSGVVVNLTNAVVTTNEGRALYSNDPENLFHLHNTTIIAENEEVARWAHRGIYVLSGSTTLMGRDYSDLIYDLRKIEVKVNPLPAEFVSGNLIKITKSGIDETKWALKYTVDGSDPRTSETAISYTDPIEIPIGGVLKYVLEMGELYGPVEELHYLEDNDRPGKVAAVHAPAPISAPCGITREFLELPQAVRMTLEDGREKYVTVTWETSRVPLEEVGAYEVFGLVNLPANLENNKGLLASLTLEVILSEISSFESNPFEHLKEGKFSVAPGASIATFSARGGDGRNYDFALTETGQDNRFFTISGNELVVAGHALTAGAYVIEAHVQSEGKELVKEFTLTIQKADPKWDISSPYADVDWAVVHQVKSALHNHTINSNHEWDDGGIVGTPASRIPVYERQGFGAVAITDHDYVSYPWSDYGVAETDVISIPGNELSKNADILSYFSTYFDRKGEGRRVTDGMFQNIVNAGEMGGFLYVAHPNRSGGATAEPAYLYSLLEYPQVLGIEVLNAGQFTRNHSEDLWDFLLTEMMPYGNMWGTASDDAHSEGSTIGTGWTYLLLDEPTQTAARSALIHGRTYFSSWRVVKGQDDQKGKPAYPAPTITAIELDQEQGTIRIDAENATTIEWVSENGALVAVGDTVDVNKTPGVNKYIRARMYGPGGQTMTQAFGLHDSTARDLVPPVITVNGTLPGAAKVGDTIMLPTSVAVDDQDPIVFSYPVVTNPDGIEILCLDNELMPEQEGVFLVTYTAVDSSGNVGELTYAITVNK